MTDLFYEGYNGEVWYDSEDNIFYGRIINIDDMVTFQTSERDKIVKEFCSAVDDYIKFCKEIGKAPVFLKERDE